ncbi:hypothetical protein PCI56_04100 [Plesiomonas shigelloides subsp. oncorhynchi]|nr:hypothetical protein [Plesiomonas shigelloides]
MLDDNDLQRFFELAVLLEKNIVIAGEPEAENHVYEGINGVRTEASTHYYH